MEKLAYYPVPDYLGILFMIVIPVPILLIALLAKKGAEPAQKNITFITVLITLLVYFSYVITCSLYGVFDKVSLPPTVLLYTTFPFGFFLALVVFYSKGYKSIVNNLATEDLIFLHVFRLIGVFFILLAYYKALPSYFAIIAGLGDMITALSCIFVAWAYKNKKQYSKKLTYVWNTFGLIDILFTAIFANVITKLSMDSGIMGVDTLASFPFCLIPAFAPPTIIMMHLAIFYKLKKNQL